MLYHKVSKQSCPEMFYMKMLQLYMPWRVESHLKEDNWSYEDKFNEVESAILSNINMHEPYLDIDYEELNNYDILESEEEEDNNDRSQHNVPMAASTIDNLLFPNEQFYEICSQLNERQQHLFNFIMTYAIKCCFAENNDQPLPESFYIFLRFCCW